MLIFMLIFLLLLFMFLLFPDWSWEDGVEKIQFPTGAASPEFSFQSLEWLKKKYQLLKLSINKA